MTRRHSHSEILRLVHYDLETGIMTRIGGQPNRVRQKHDRYRRIRIDGVLYYEHRLAWFYMTGEWIMVDHENTIKTDNKWKNLRPANKSLNGANRGVTVRSTSGFKGVTFDAQRSKWLSQIVCDGVHYFLGRYDSPEEAHAAYVIKAEELFGQYARAA